VAPRAREARAESREDLGPRAISAKMLAVLRKVDAAREAYLAGLRENARQDAENEKKRRAAGRRPAWTPAKNRRTAT
jgi:hypothetical protein